VKGYRPTADEGERAAVRLPAGARVGRRICVAGGLSGTFVWITAALAGVHLLVATEGPAVVGLMCGWPLVLLIGGFWAYARSWGRLAGCVLAAGYRVCPKCHYELAGLDANICPECGGRFSIALLRTSWRPIVLRYGDDAARADARSH
jgi:hypothetical protein